MCLHRFNGNDDKIITVWEKEKLNKIKIKTKNSLKYNKWTNKTRLKQINIYTQTIFYIFFALHISVLCSFFFEAVGSR